MGLNTLSLAHKFIKEHVKPGDFCMDATAGKGRDTLLLCQLVGPTGKILALDIQPEAIQQTEQLLKAHHMDTVAHVICDDHCNLAAYAEPESVDCIVFNLGWLPGGNHQIYTRPATSIPAIQAGLTLLKPGGIMSLCIYYGKENGFTERDAVLNFLQSIDPSVYTVIVSQFHNRAGNPPIPVCILKEV